MIYFSNKGAAGVYSPDQIAARQKSWAVLPTAPNAERLDGKAR